jgi:hypothetical protein
MLRVLIQKCFVEITEKNEKMRVYLKPSEFLNLIESYMRILLSIENHREYFIKFDNILFKFYSYPFLKHQTFKFKLM